MSEVGKKYLLSDINESLGRAILILDDWFKRLDNLF